MRSLVALICSAVVLLTGPAWSCSPPIGDVPELTKAQSAHFADTILVGKILETHPDPDMYGDDVYSATMKVYCIYKGQVSASVVNITHVGIIPGLCHATSLVKGSEYVVYLTGEQHRITDVEIENTEQHRLDVSKACGLHLHYPDGVSKEDLPHTCPEPASATDCTPEYKGNHDDEHGHESHDIEGQGHDDHGHEGHGHDDFDHDGHDHVGHTHEEHDEHDEKDKEEHVHHDGHGHDSHDHDGHDHEGHGHEDFKHEGHDHEGHTHEEHDEHDETHEHEHEEGHHDDHDHEHDAHEHDGHDHDGHDDDGHDHDEYDHKGHDHGDHTHEEHDKHDKHHDDEHEHKVEAGAAHGSDSSSSRGSCAIGVLLLSLGLCLSL